ncbi:hypothetical protein LRS06_05570 [Hymenobacter sp. J193]|uniref:DUF6252 family protein n=1 Tax=Hymenobacter sp. J193 TaxID=2898429 RepID=UPI002150F268|nr:DUF6252 family protein [Hymenobacter sp. J193]MCR5887255.1 hypothetical protein [Hymenobacter sp. J193]
MKTKHPLAFRLLTLLLCLPLLTACSSDDKEDDPDPTTENSGDEVRWTVSGTEYAGFGSNVQTQGHYRPSNTDNKKKELLILADDSKNYQVSVLIDGFTGKGTYTLVPNGDSRGGLTEITGAKNTYISVWAVGSPAGKVEITEWDPATTHVKGTFSFKGRVRNSGGTFGPSVEVTSGSFNFKSVYKY